MAQAERTPDPLARDLDEAYRLYQQLAAKVPPNQASGGRRRAPASRPPVSIDPLSLMAELDRYLGWWIRQARYALDPWTKIDLTARTGARCPYCGADLVCWLRPTNEGASEVVCTGLDHPDTEPRRWAKAEWSWLGKLAGVHVDAPSGGARPPWPHLRAVEG
jgi:hypothetical protein